MLDERFHPRKKKREKGGRVVVQEGGSSKETRAILLEWVRDRNDLGELQEVGGAREENNGLRRDGGLGALDCP